MTQLKHKPLFMAILALATAFVFSCSSDDDGGKDKPNSNSGAESSSSEAVTQSSSSEISITEKGKIVGVSQKGPFAKGSAITLSELNDKLSQTGRSFEATITDDKGSFEIVIKDADLASPYVMLKASGYYRNEVTGNISNGTINLYAIADIREKSNVNVNILTHLEYNRVLKLVEGGKSLKEAKKQAQKEILAVFGISGEFKDSEDMSIFGTGEGDATLLAISILLQGSLTEGQFTERLADFNLGFKETGNWDSKKEKDDMAEWAENANLEGMRSNILGWKMSSSVPDFEKVVRDYWQASYGLGSCDTKQKDAVKKSIKGEDYVCKGDAWTRASETEIQFGVCSKEGEIKEGQLPKPSPQGSSSSISSSSSSATNSNTTIYYICKDKNWEIATDYDILGVCSKEGEVKTGRVSGAKYICKNKAWVTPTYIEIKCYESECLTFTDDRDGQSYVYFKIEDQTWMAENLNYAGNSGECRAYYQEEWISSSDEEKQALCKKYGRLYSWEQAMKACPKGWHLPSDEEWMKYVAVNLPENEQCFVTNSDNSKYIFDVGDYGIWWSSSEGVAKNDNAKVGASEYAYYNFRDKQNSYDCVYSAYFSKDNRLQSVRCIQD